MKGGCRVQAARCWCSGLGPRASGGGRTSEELRKNRSSGVVQFFFLSECRGK
jgi:hypothetical protein